MKVAIVVPYSWSFWGGVVDHAEQQVLALRKLGVDAWLDHRQRPAGLVHARPPPGRRPAHGAAARRASGRAVGDRAGERLAAEHRPDARRRSLRIKRIFERERFDLIHVHEPMTPAIGVAALALWRGRRSRRSTRAASSAGLASAVRSGASCIGSHRPAHRRVGAGARFGRRWLPGEYEVVPNGVLVPRTPDPANREHHVIFIGRHEPRKGMPVLLRAWPEIHRRTGARLRLVGADPLAVRLVLSRERVSHEGIDMLGVLTNDELTDELLRAKVQVASSLGGESFGMVLDARFACAVPVVASDIPGYRAVHRAATRRAGAAGRPRRARGRGRRAARRRGARAARGASPRARCASSGTRGTASRDDCSRSTRMRPRGVARAARRWFRMAFVLLAAAGVSSRSGGAGPRGTTCPMRSRWSAGAGCSPRSG